jgi:hypothetical protein
MATKKLDALGRFTKLHGMSHSKEHRAWANMLYRCETPSAPQYAYYGGRGISVCERWKDFELFFLDMGLAPSAQFSIERIEVNGNYSPENCKWVSAKEQARNRRNTRFVEINGVTKSAIEWSEILCIPWPVVTNRLRRNWPMSRLFTAPRAYCNANN